MESPLLSLNGGVEDFLLSYVSSGDGGLKTILNLRQVCSVTHSWVDRLPRHQAKKIFAVCHAKVDFRGKDNPFDKLEIFLQNPPPAGLTSLYFIGSRAFEGMQFTPYEEKLWNCFVHFWWDKLESLEVDYIDNLVGPKESCVKQLLSSPSIRSLHCGKLKEEEDNPDSLEFPRGLFEVEHLSIDSINLSPIQAGEFFASLARAPRLKSFTLSVLEMKDMEEMTNFIVSTKDKVKLEVSFAVDFHPIGKPWSVIGEPLQRLPSYFVTAVAASSASIRILQVEGGQLDNLKQLVGKETARKFFKAVEWISNFEVTAVNDDLIIEFPNLKGVGLLGNPVW